MTPKTQVVTILFCDLVASTERRARMGDDHFDAFSSLFLRAIRDEIARTGGREISNAGDGLMVVFTDSAADAVSCAIDMHRTVAQLDHDDPPSVRIGISCGELAQDGDQFSGMPIVEAARLQAVAAPGQTLANALVRSLVGSRRALRFRPVGALKLKGIPKPLETVEVLDETVADTSTPIGPAWPNRPGSTPASRLLRWVVVLAAAALLLVGIGAVIVLAGNHGPNRALPSVVSSIPKPKNYSPHYDAVKCPTDVRGTVPGVTCGYLMVPQDRNHPSGRQVRLLVEQAPARTPSAANPEPTIDVCGCDNLATSVVRDRASLIQIGERGFTNSDPVLTCPEMVAVTQAGLTKPSDDPAILSQQMAALAVCRHRFITQGINLADYNSETAALDVRDLMYIRHIHSADFIASELTSEVVFELVRNYPAAVRSITLDNPVPPGFSLLANPIGDLSEAFNHYLKLCQDDPLCSKGYPGLAAAYLSADSKLNIHPQLVSAPNPDNSNAPPIPVLLDGHRAADALAASLGDPSTYSLIPAAITSSTTSNELIATEVLKGDYYAWHTEAPWGALASYFCSYDIHTFDPNAVALAARTLPQFQGDMNTHWQQWCSAWRVPDVSTELSNDIASSVPALLLRGDLSPAGDSSWTQTIQSRLPNAQSAIFPTLGDGLLESGPPCLAELRRTFLANPTTPLNTTSCVKNSPPITFVAPP